MEKQKLLRVFELGHFWRPMCGNFFFSNLSYSTPNFLYDFLTATTLLPEWAKMAPDVVLFFHNFIFNLILNSLDSTGLSNLNFLQLKKGKFFFLLKLFSNLRPMWRIHTGFLRSGI